MQIYFHSRLCSYLSRVPILVEGTVCSLLQRYIAYKLILGYTNSASGLMLMNFMTYFVTIYTSVLIILSTTLCHMHFIPIQFRPTDYTYKNKHFFNIYFIS